MNNRNEVRSSNPRQQEFLYAPLVDLRNTELSIYWTRYNILSAVNFGLLAVVLSASDDSFVPTMRTLVSLGGVLIAVIWLLFTVKGKQLLKNRWDQNISIYENKCIDNPDLRLFSRVLENESKKKWLRKNWDNLNILARSLPALCIVAWIIFWRGRL